MKICKLSFAKTTDGTAYAKALEMNKHQENTIAGHSTGCSWIGLDRKVHLRKAVGKTINFLAKYPDVPKSNMCLFHSRYATCGAINETNQHPISIMYKGKRIGYGVHNGMWLNYKDYEYMRNPNIKNLTDSALLFTIYSKSLEKNGDSRINRRKALGTMRTFVKGENNNNFIIMFDDGQVIFSGNALTFEEGKKVGIMTFGLKNKTNFSNIYEVKGQRVLKFNYQRFNNYFPEPKPKKEKKIEIKNQKQTTLNKYHKFIDGNLFRLYSEKYLNQGQAQSSGELLKKRHNLQYRTEKNKNNKWSLYVRGKK